MKKLLIILAFLFSLSSISQEIKSYSWDEKPVFKQIPEEYKNQPAVVLFDKRWIHTRVGQYAFATFVMNHFAIKIIKAEEINKYNKIKAEDNGYIRTLRDFHARIIKPNGEIKVLPEDKIIETEIDKVKSIVFEGVEAGDILEYYFILKENPNAYGVEVFQKDIPVLEAEFSTTHDGVSFQRFTSPEFSESTIKRKTTSSATNLPPYVEENNSKNVKNLIKVIYSLYSGYNTYSWYSFLPQYFAKPSFIYFKKSQAKEFLTKLNLKSLPTDEKVLKLDEYIKENFDFVWRGEKAQKLKNLNNGKLKLNASDIFDLYGYCFKELDISFKVVIGMSRFMGDVDASTYVVPLSHEFMYYITETQKFVSPYEKYLSYGYPMYEVQGSNAKTYQKASSSSVSDMVFPIAPASFTVTETVNNVTLSDDLSKISLQKTYSNTGYEGQMNRNYIKYLKENEEEKELTDYLKNRMLSGLDLKLDQYDFLNLEFKNNYSNTPFVSNLKTTINETLQENAGNLILLNIGKVIGSQSDLYQETTRKFDVDLKYAKIYKHKILVTIPAGYKIESYSDLVIDKKMAGDEDKNCSFKSTVTVNGNQVVIEVLEAYNAINYPKANYEEYRKVINASSDFTKASLVLKPL